MENIKDKKVFVAGCGGLGCYIVENLIRMQVGKIVVCDGDIFSESNLNRQLYSRPGTINELKVKVAKMRAEALEYKGEFKVYDTYLNEENISEMIKGCDIAIDALDNTQARFILEDACTKEGMPLVHGAVGEWNYQIAVSMPGSNLLHSIYQGMEMQNEIPTFAFTVQVCAASETAEAVKLLAKEKSELENSLLIADLKHNTYEIIKMA